MRSIRSPIAEGFPARKLALYVLAQLMGAICAALVAISLLLHLPTVGATAMADIEIGFPFPAAGAGRAFLAEVIGTTAVVYVMLNVATVRHLARNSFFGIAIGITIASVGSAIGPVSGGCLNPAVGLLGAVATAWHAGSHSSLHRLHTDVSPIWVYFVAPPLGGVVGALLFRAQNHATEYSSKAFEPLEVVSKRYQAMTEGNEEHQRFMVHLPAVPAKPAETTLAAASFLAKLKAKKAANETSTATHARSASFVAKLKANQAANETPRATHARSRVHPVQGIADCVVPFDSRIPSVGDGASLHPGTKE